MTTARPKGSRSTEAACSSSAPAAGRSSTWPRCSTPTGRTTWLLGATTRASRVPGCLRARCLPPRTSQVFAEPGGFLVYIDSRVNLSATETTSGISFALSGEQRALRGLAHDFAVREIRPVAADYDERSQHPADVIAKAHEVGLMNPHIPEEYGGPGLSAFEQILTGEELAWGCSGVTTSILANILRSLPVLLAGSDEQKREWVQPLLEEPLLCSFALTEPGAGSDVSAIQTTAEPRDGEYVLNGSKMFITNAGEAAWFVIFASTDREAGHRGLSAFVVPADSNGVVVGEDLDKLRPRADATTPPACQDGRGRAADRAGGAGRGGKGGGEGGEGLKMGMGGVDFTRPGTAAGAVGVARAAFEHAVEYAKTRVQFGQPIAINQGVNFLVADMAAEIEAARLLTWQA